MEAYQNHRRCLPKSGFTPHRVPPLPSFLWLSDIDYLLNCINIVINLRISSRHKEPRVFRVILIKYASTRVYTIQFTIRRARERTHRAYVSLKGRFSYNFGSSISWQDRQPDSFTNKQGADANTIFLSTVSPQAIFLLGNILLSLYSPSFYTTK